MAQVKNSNDSGSGSLRDAIQEAASGETITFAKSLNGQTIVLESELVVDKPLKIQGPGADKLAISGNQAVRVFRIKHPAVKPMPVPDKTKSMVTISGLMIKDGNAAKEASGFPCCGGGILNQGDLKLEKVILANNMAVGDNDVTIDLCGKSLTGNGVGGGIANLHKLWILDSSFEGNQARGGWKSSNSSSDGANTFPGNACGGGIASVGMAEVDIINCKFNDNVARAGDDCDGSGPLTAPCKTDFAGDAFGGAIASVAFTPAKATTKNTASLSVKDSHFSNNQVIGGDRSKSPLLPGHTFGGAIASHRFNGLADLQVKNCKFADNQSLAGNENEVSPQLPGESRAVPNAGAAGALFACGTGKISHSLFSNNQARGGWGAVSSTVLDVNKNGGDARGGAIGFAFSGTDLTVRDCEVTGNWAVGGTAGPGGHSGNGCGGGVVVTGSAAPPYPKVAIIGGSIDNNQALGGFGSQGEGIGGGLYYLVKPKFNPMSITNNHASTSNPDIFPKGLYIVTPSGGGDGLGGGVFNDANTETSLAAEPPTILPDASITNNWAEDYLHHRARILEELFQLIRELLGKLHLVTKPPLPPPSPWLEQWQAQWLKVIAVLGRVHLDPAQDQAAKYLPATRREFEATADLVRAAFAAPDEEQAKLVRKLGTRVGKARASFDQLVQAAERKVELPRLETGRFAPVVTPGPAGKPLARRLPRRKPGQVADARKRPHNSRQQE